MIKRTKDGFAIHIKTESNPADLYVGIINDLVNTIQDKDPTSNTDNSFHVFELLRQMLPNYEQARKLFDKEVCKE